MRQIKSTATLLLVASFCLVSFGFKACSQSEKDRNVALARDIAGALRAAAPIVARKAPQFSARLMTAINDADRLIDAVAADNSTLIVDHVRAILPVVSDIVTGLPNDDEIQIALALGQIGLNFYVDHYLNRVVAAKAPMKRGAGADPSSDAAIVGRFKSLPQFGCRRYPERCK